MMVTNHAASIQSKSPFPVQIVFRFMISANAVGVWTGSLSDLDVNFQRKYCRLIKDQERLSQIKNRISFFSGMKCGSFRRADRSVFLTAGFNWLAWSFKAGLAEELNSVVRTIIRFLFFEIDKNLESIAIFIFIPDLDKIRFDFHQDLRIGMRISIIGLP